MPGLVDCHIHAEQIINAGANYEKAFQDWVFQDFFPTGQQFGMDPEYARNTSSLLVVCNIFVKGNSYLSFPTQLPQFVLLFLILLHYTSFIHSYYGRKHLSSSIACFNRVTNRIHINKCDGVDMAVLPFLIISTSPSVIKLI